MKKITIELTDSGGYRINGMENIESRSESIWLMLAARHIEDGALKKGYLPDLEKGLEEWVDKNNTDKIRLLTEKEHENLGIGKPLLPTYISIELPNNVPSNIKPIVILPRICCEKVTVKAVQYEKGFTEFETTLDLTQSHIINLNTGV